MHMLGGYGMYGYGYGYRLDPTIFLVLIGVLLSLWAQNRVNSTFARYSRVRSFSGMTGAEAARRLLNAQGIYDVTVQPVIDLFRAHRNPSGELTLDDSELRAARALVGRRGLQVSGADLSFARSGMGITLDGIAKGYIADRVSAVLTSAGVKNHLVNAGGDIMASGHKSPGVPWRVAVQSPTGPAYAGELSLSGKAIATSGSYEIYYDASRRNHHLINPASGFSPAVGSVSVVAGTAMEADTLATALSILPPTDALKLVQGLPGRECCILSPGGYIYTSPGWASFA